jgi:hypothetical protein
MTKLLIIAVLLCGVSVILTGLLMFIASQRLLRYLKKNKSERWAELTTVQTSIGELGPGARNTKKLYEYVYSSLDNDDEELFKRKKAHRIAIRCLTASILMFIGLFVILIFWGHKK